MVIKVIEWFKRLLSVIIRSNFTIKNGWATAVAQQSILLILMKPLEYLGERSRFQWQFEYTPTERAQFAKYAFDILID